MSNSTKTPALPLVLAGLGSPIISLTKDAIEARDGHLGRLVNIQDILDPQAAESVAASLQDAKGFLREIERGRTEVKRPLLDLGRNVDAMAKELVADLTQETNRVARILGDYQLAQRRREEAARREAEAAEAKAREEARRKLEAATTQRQRTRAVAQFEKRVDAAAAKVEAASAPRLEGISARTVRKFDVHCVRALFKAHPDLCHISPNGPAIRAFIKDRDEADQVPGLRFWDEATATIRTR